MNLICTLRFSDGQCVSATMKAESPEARCPIEYQGPVDRLAWRPVEGDPLDFKVLFRSLAREYRAALEEREEGEYDPALRHPTHNGKPVTFEQLDEQKKLWGKFEE